MKKTNIKSENALFLAIAELQSKDEVKRFMLDLCTPSEIAAFAERWEIAKLLDKQNLGYREIAEQTGASTTTVTRVARFLFNENNNGYRIILDRLNK